MASASALKLAESYEWDALQMVVEIEPRHAKDRDMFGNLPLHWACTDENVPLEVLQILIEAYPEGASP